MAMHDMRLMRTPPYPPTGALCSPCARAPINSDPRLAPTSEWDTCASHAIVTVRYGTPRMSTLREVYTLVEIIETFGAFALLIISWRKNERKTKIGFYLLVSAMSYVYVLM